MLRHRPQTTANSDSQGEGVHEARRIGAHGITVLRMTSSTAAAPRRILLVDCDAYFVQVARLEDPEGAGREALLLVGGSASGRGVITSASYECRPFGVRSGMPTARALRLCPAAKVVPVPRGACSRIHEEIRVVLEQWAPVVSAASIDEFYLDLSGTERLYHDAPLDDVARRIREAVLERTRIDVSIGGGTTRLVAKMAVSRAKPAGVHVVPAGGEAAFMRGCMLRAIPGIGPKAEERLAKLGLRSVADAVDLGHDALLALVGRGFGEWLWRRAHGIDSSRVTSHRDARSISRDETFSRDIDDDAALERELLRLVTRAAADLRGEALRARTVTVRIRDADFRNRSASRTLPEPVESDRPIHEVAVALLAKLRRARRTPARLISVALTHFDGGAGGMQLGLLDDVGGSLETERERRLAHTLDRIRDKHGRRSIRPGPL
jgi:DNA polymerase IV